MPLGEALETLIDHRGKTPKKLGGDWSVSGHRVVSALNIKNSGVDDNEHHFISDEMYERWMKEKLRTGDVILTSEAPTGEVAYLARNHEWALGQRVFGLRGKEGVLDGRYLFYALRGGDLRHDLMSRTTGTTVQGIRQAELVKVEISLPQIAEQRAIAATLGAIDDKIASNLRAVALLSSLLDAVSDKFGDALPTVCLGDIVTVAKESANPAKLTECLVDHFSLPAFDNGARPERVLASSIMSNKLRVPRHAILLSRLNPRFNRTWWASAEVNLPALASTEFLVLTTRDEVELAAAWLAVRDRFFREELPKRVTGTSGSHQRVRPDDVLAIEVPDFSKASDHVKKMALGLLNRADCLRTESESLASLRDALLPELLSGRIRAADVEIPL